MTPDAKRKRAFARMAGMTRLELTRMLAACGYTRATASAAADVVNQAAKAVETCSMAQPLGRPEE